MFRYTDLMLNEDIVKKKKLVKECIFFSSSEDKKFNEFIGY